MIASKPRDDSDKKGCKCVVYDVIFHPETLELAVKNRQFRDLVEDTASSTIKENFGVILNVKSAKYPKMKYKGKSPHIVLRRKIGSNETNVECEPIGKYWEKNLENSVKKYEEQSLPQQSIIPKYAVKYRDIIDMKDFSLMGYTDKCAPKEIIVEIMLPGVQSANDIELDIYERRLILRSHQNLNHRYYLDVDLSYAVNATEGRAKFDKSNNKLTVQLPLKDRGIPVYSYTNTKA